MNHQQTMLDHFRERQRVYPAALGLPMLVAIAEVLIAIKQRGSWPAQWWSVAVPAFVALLFVALTYLIRELSIRVNPDELIFGFGPLRRRVRISDITNVRIVDSGEPDTGIGVRRVSDGRMAWIARRGTAVEVRVTQPSPRAPVAYIISTGRPHDLVAALQAGQGSRAVERP